ncbi:MAG: hypothetical protein AMS24_00525 [Chlamydiae bacterium SM23_39]|nr:MAG: hypothetical protein AMS24_00525 [Chlamydiae bacterium SM23_39]
MWYFADGLRIICLASKIYSIKKDYEKKSSEQIALEGAELTTDMTNFVSDIYIRYQKNQITKLDPEKDAEEIQKLVNKIDVARTFYLTSELALGGFDTAYYICGKDKKTIDHLRFAAKTTIRTKRFLDEAKSKDLFAEQGKDPERKKDDSSGCYIF